MSPCRTAGHFDFLLTGTHLTETDGRHQTHRFSITKEAHFLFTKATTAV